MSLARFQVRAMQVASFLFATAHRIRAASAMDYPRDTQSALNPAGAPADYIHALWWRTFWMLAIVYIITMLLVLIGVWRNRAPVPNNDFLIPPPQQDRRAVGMIGAGVGI